MIKLNNKLVRKGNNLIRFNPDYLPDCLIGFWKFDGTRESSYVKEKHFRQNGIPTYVNGKIGQGILTSSGNFLYMNTDIDISRMFALGSPWSIATWMKFGGISSFEPFTITGGTSNLQIDFMSSTPTAGDLTSIRINNVSHGLLSSDDLVSSQWNLFIITYENVGLSSTFNVYINNILQYSDAVFPNIGSSKYFYLSKYCDDDTIAYDHLRLYRKVLNSTERTNLWNNGDGI